MKISFIFIWLEKSTYFCDVFVAHYKIAISNFDMKTSHIVVYVILFKNCVRLYFLDTQANRDPNVCERSSFMSKDNVH
jgi:hypothetical protein